MTLLHVHSLYITKYRVIPMLFLHCNYNLTCSISAHAQTLNEYPDTKNTREYPNNE